MQTITNSVAEGMCDLLSIGPSCYANPGSPDRPPFGTFGLANSTGTATSLEHMCRDLEPRDGVLDT